MIGLTNPPGFETELKPVGMGVYPTFIMLRLSVHAGASCSGAGLAFICHLGCMTNGVTILHCRQALPRSPTTKPRRRYNYHSYKC